MDRNRQNEFVDLLPTLNYAPPEKRRSRAGRTFDDVIDAVGPRTAAFIGASTLFFFGLRFGGFVGVIMIFASGFLAHLLIELWYRSSRWW